MHVRRWSHQTSQWMTSSGPGLRAGRNRCPSCRRQASRAIVASSRGMPTISAVRASSHSETLVQPVPSPCRRAASMKDHRAGWTPAARLTARHAGWSGTRPGEQAGTMAGGRWKFSARCSAEAAVRCCWSFSARRPCRPCRCIRATRGTRCRRRGTHRRWPAALLLGHDHELDGPPLRPRGRLQRKLHAVLSSSCGTGREKSRRLRTERVSSAAPPPEGQYCLVAGGISPAQLERPRLGGDPHVRGRAVAISARPRRSPAAQRVVAPHRPGRPHRLDVRLGDQRLEDQQVVFVRPVP